MNEIQIGDINVTHPECENVTGSLTSLENFTYSNAKMACILQENLHRTIFKGVTVSHGIHACMTHTCMCMHVDNESTKYRGLVFFHRV